MEVEIFNICNYIKKFKNMLIIVKKKINLQFTSPLYISIKIVKNNS